MNTTPFLYWPVLLGALTSLGLGHGLAWAFARGLRLRLTTRRALAGLSVPVVVLLFWGFRDRLLVPCDGPIARLLPDAPVVEQPDDHGLLNDAVLQFLPWEAEVRRSLGRGRLPLWSDVLEGGSSPWVNPQAGILSPINLLTRHIPIEHWPLVAFAVKLLLAFHGASLLAAAIGARETPSILAGFALSLGPLAPWAVFPHSSAIALMPWLVLAAVKLVRANDRRILVTTAAILASIVWCGHPETAFAAGCLAAVAALALGRRGSVLRSIPRCLVAVALGAMLAGLQLIPFVSALPNTQRSTRMLERLSSREERANDPRSVRSLEFPRLLLRPLHPWAFGRPYHEANEGPAAWPALGAGYAGLVMLAGAAFGLSRPRGRRRSVPFLGFALFSLLVSAGFGPLTWLLNRSPLLWSFVPNRFLPAGALALILCGAIGCDALLRQRHPRRLALGAVAAAALLSLVTRFDAMGATWWLVIVVSAACLHSSRRALAAVLVVASLGDLGLWAHDHLPQGHRVLFYPRTPAIVAVEREVQHGGRAVGVGRAVYPSLLPMYGIPEARPHNPMAPAAQLSVLERVFGFRPEAERYKGAFRNVDHPLVDFLGIRAIVAEKHDPELARFRLRTGAQGAKLLVFRNPASLPTFFLPSAVELATDEDLLDRVVALRRGDEVVVTNAKAFALVRGREREWNHSALQVRREPPGRFTVTYEGAGPALVASSLPSPEGWTARSLDGTTLERVEIDRAFLGFVMPADVRQATVTFTPPGFRLGCLLSMVASLACLLLLVRRSRLSAPHAAA